MEEKTTDYDFLRDFLSTFEDKTRMAFDGSERVIIEFIGIWNTFIHIFESYPELARNILKWDFDTNNDIQSYNGAENIQSVQWMRELKEVIDKFYHLYSPLRDKRTMHFFALAREMPNGNDESTYRGSKNYRKSEINI